MITRQADWGIACHTAYCLFAFFVAAAQQQIGDAFFRQNMGDIVAINHHGWNRHIRLLCQLPGKHTAASVSRALKLDAARVESKVRSLKEIGFLIEKDGALTSQVESFHLGKDSHLLPRLHANWRLKSMHELTGGLSADALHYTSVMTITDATARKIRDSILRHLEETRADIAAADSKALYFYGLDFFPLVRE